MKFHVNSYHLNLLKDNIRLSVFFEALSDLSKTKRGIVFDIGAGSGILSYFSSLFFEKVVAIEKDNVIFDFAKHNLKNIDNVKLINEDILDFKPSEKADIVICEMLDTALIDEEEVLAINHIQKFINKDSVIIPSSIINVAELVNMEREYLHYDDLGSKTNYKVLSNPNYYSEYHFKNKINPKFKDTLKFNIIRYDLPVNGLKLTTYTKLTENIICGPTPMLNPPILIPLNNKSVKINDIVKVDLEYIMSGGIETIKAKIW